MGARLAIAAVLVLPVVSGAAAGPNTGTDLPLFDPSHPDANPGANSNARWAKRPNTLSAKQKQGIKGLMTPGEGFSGCSDTVPFVTLTQRVVLCTSPKAASTVWRRLFVCLQAYDTEAEHILKRDVRPKCQRDQPDLDCCGRLLRMRDLNTTLVHAMWQARHFARLSLVRNPMTRVVSGFRESRRIAVDLRREPEEEFALTTDWLDAHNTSLLDDGKKGFHAFVDEFIVAESEQYGLCPPQAFNEHDVSQHWYPQHCRCGYQSGLHWSLLKMEDGPAIVNALRANIRVGSGPQRCHEEIKAVGSRKLTDYRTQKRMNEILCGYYGDVETFDKVADARQGEIEHFDYGQDVQVLRGWLIKNCAKRIVDLTQVVIQAKVDKMHALLNETKVGLALTAEHDGRIAQAQQALAAAMN